VHLAPGERSPDEVDGGSEISIGDITVTVDASDGTFTVRDGERAWPRLFGVEDVGDAGDTYDFDPIPGDQPVTRPSAVTIERRRHPSGIAELAVHRTFERPSGEFDVWTTVRLAHGVDRVDVDVELDNRATDHRLRLLFPTGAPVEHYAAAATFDTARRTAGLPDARGWMHAPPRTIPHQGWIAANGLTVAAPGLPEAEVTTDGTIAVTLVRAVGWLARITLSTRPIPAGPGHPTPGAQCLGRLATRLSLFTGTADPASVRAAELGFRAVCAGPEPLLAEGGSAFAVDGDVVLSTLKPAADGDGTVVRVLNPNDEPASAVLRWARPPTDVTSVRLDESALDGPLDVDGATVTIAVPPHALRSVLAC
jgi:alpha-mannosidase